MLNRSGTSFTIDTTSNGPYRWSSRTSSISEALMSRPAALISRASLMPNSRRSEARGNDSFNVNLSTTTSLTSRLSINTLSLRSSTLPRGAAVYTVRSKFSRAVVWASIRCDSATCRYHRRVNNDANSPNTSTPSMANRSGDWPFM